MRRGTWAAVLALCATLAVPVGAAAHPFTIAEGAFGQGLPQLGFALKSQPLAAQSVTFDPNADWERLNLTFNAISERTAANLGQANSDLAFQGNRAYQGTFQGFRILDITNPAAPAQLLNFEGCNGSQGDVVVHGNILTRSWDAPAGSSATCDGRPVPAGTQGLHVFDISNEANPELVAYVPTPCGSHTATGVPTSGALVVYSTPSSGSCPGIDVINIPTAAPEDASYVRFASAGKQIACHDTGVILGDVMRAACAGGQGFAVWDLDSAGGVLNPRRIYSKNVKKDENVDMNTGHSAAFTNDGETLVIGHEPDGGVQARCQATGAKLNSSQYPRQTDDMKSFFFFDTESGELVGRWTLPRAQSALENCTLHNYNVVPLQSERDILVHGSYQSGIGVLDFTDPANAVELGYADPPALNPSAFTLGGDWSSHFYNGTIYQSDITRGFASWTYTADDLDGAVALPRLNPQTQTFTTG